MLRYKHKIVSFTEKLKMQGIFNVKTLEDLKAKELWHYEEFRELADSFIKIKTLRQKYSNHTIINYLTQIITTLAQHANPGDHIMGLLEEGEWALLPLRPYTVHLPVKGIELNQPFLEFGSSCALKRTSLQKSDSFLFSPAFVKAEHAPRPIVQSFPVPVEHDCLASEHYFEFVFHTADPDKASETALEAGKTAISYLRFHDYLAQNWSADCLGLRLPGFGPAVEELQMFIVNQEQQPISCFREKYSQNTLKINAETIAAMKNNGYEKFVSILSALLSANLEEMHTSLLCALNIFGEARVEPNTSCRYLKLMLAVECLLAAAESGAAGLPLSEGVAFVLGRDRSERLELEKYFRRLERERLHVLEKGESALNIVCLFDLEYYTAALIRTFLTEDAWFLTLSKKDLVQKIKTLKYS